MTDYNKYSTGSVWNKWDLHIHTPASFFWNGGKNLKDMIPQEKENSLKDFIKSVNDSDVEVFCIMDYWTFDWYLELKEYLKDYPNLLNKLILPGIELRIECPVDYRLNIHCILSDKLSKQNLIDFKSELYIRSIDKKLSDEALINFAKSLDTSKARKFGFNDPERLSEHELLQLGSKTAEITKDSLNKSFQQIPKDSGFIILPYDTSDGLLKLKWEDHPHDDNYFMQSAHIFETRDQKNIDLICGKKTSENEQFFDNFFKTIGSKPKPCISGSDAHRFVDYGIFPSNKITWIKANPSFEGLKQIIYEPTERVRIQTLNPYLDFRKAYFRKITLNEGSIIKNQTVHFKTDEIELNPELVTIIGGRGTGKSLLLDVIAKTFGKTKGNDRIEGLNDELNFIITYKKTDDSNLDFKLSEIREDLDYLHVHQSEIKDIVKDANKLDEKIKNMLNITEKKLEETYDSKSESLINSIFEINDWIQIVDEDKNFINQKEYNEKQKSRVQKLLDTITTEDKKIKIESFIKNKEAVNEADITYKELKILKDELEKYSIIKNEIIEILNKDQKKEDIIPKIEFNKQLEIIDTRIINLNQIKDSLNESNRLIKEEFVNEGIAEDISSLFDKVDGYQNKKRIYEGKIREHDKKIIKYSNDIKDLEELYRDFITILKEMKTNINNSWQTLRYGKAGWTSNQIEILKLLLKDISINTVVKFDIDKFYELLQPCLFGNKFKATREESILQRIRSTLNVNSFYDYIHLISNKPIIKLNQLGFVCLTDFLKMDYFNFGQEKEFARKLFISDFRNDYLKVIADIKYRGKYPNQISVGQRGTMFICLQLATDPFIKPFVYDQPEDDLDNNFIMNELVPIFKQIKKYRQVIIVTHNANLVVNADAEQIIVAHNDNEEISFVSGALEHSFELVKSENNQLFKQGVREHVCDILEGGEDAFAKREKKYGFA